MKSKQKFVYVGKEEYGLEYGKYDTYNISRITGKFVVATNKPENEYGLYEIIELDENDFITLEEYRNRLINGLID